MTQKKFMGTTRREIFMLEAEYGDLFRELAAAKGIKKVDLFREMIIEAAEKNKELLRKWRELAELRK